MAYVVFNSDRDGYSAETSRRWIGAFLTAMHSVGFQHTADAGQVTSENIGDFPLAEGTYPYSVFSLNDSLHGSHPVFFKVEFSIPAGSGSSPAMYLTVGRGTNGTGGITGILVPRTACADSGQTNTNGGRLSEPTDHFAGAGHGWVAIQTGITPRTASPVACAGFVIERSRNARGEITGDGLMVVCRDGSTTMTATGTENRVFAVNYASGAANQGASPVIMAGSLSGAPLGPSTSFAAGSIGPVAPWDMIAPGLAPWRSCVLVSIPAGDMPSGVFETTVCGRVTRFLGVPPGSSNSRWGFAFHSSSTVSRWFGVGFRIDD